MASSRSALSKNISLLISEKKRDGTRLTRTEKAKLHENTLKILDNYKESIQNANALVGDKNLSTSKRKKFAVEADRMNEVMKKLNGLPEGRSKRGPNGESIPSKESEFKEKTLEQSKELAESIKNLINSIKGFFKSFGRDNETAPTP